MGKILIKNKKSHKPSNNTDTKRLTDQPANPSNEPVSPSNNTGGKTQRRKDFCQPRNPCEMCSAVTRRQSLYQNKEQTIMNLWSLRLLGLKNSIAKEKSGLDLVALIIIKRIFPCESFKLFLYARLASFCKGAITQLRLQHYN